MACDKAPCNHHLVYKVQGLSYFKMNITKIIKQLEDGWPTSDLSQIPKNLWNASCIFKCTEMNLLPAELVP